MELYRLDDLWVLRCDYGRSSELFASELIEQVRYVWVAPAADFTGVWINYYVNGQRSHEIQYRNGQSLGTSTTFHSNGSKAVVQHRAAEGADGEEIGYFRSGAVAYRGPYSRNQQVGTWVWYNEDGSVQSTQDH
jgi:antitoxin component YwqK of YwqJK toxin-antitoxin module